MRYRVNNHATTHFKSPNGVTVQLSPSNFVEAIERSHIKIDLMMNAQVNISELLGMRNLSAFIGEVFAASLIESTNNLFIKNPHQDGYPDLLLMDHHGQQIYNTLQQLGKLRDKQPFSPFQNGGIEVKATCGSVPTPTACLRLGLEGKPEIGDQRIPVMNGYDWKAHHRETNNLAGIVWDFINSRPRIVAVFFSAFLIESNWSEIVQPRAGGGRTTSVSIMTRDGIYKMYQNWIAIYEDDQRYATFFNRKNRSNLI